MKNYLYDITLKPFFFKLSPEDAHDLSKNLLSFADAMPGVFSILQEMFTYRSKRLEVNAFGIQFPNPLGMAAGFDKTGELYPFLARLGFGHVEVGTITGEEQPGNPKPRLFRYEEAESLVNRMGFNNPGALKAKKTIVSQKKTIPRGINAGKTKLVEPEHAVFDYTKTISELAPLSDYGVINISSPNTPGLRDFQELGAMKELVEGIRKELGGEFPIPMLIKFAPDLEEDQLRVLLDAALELRLDGVILTNTTIDKAKLQTKRQIETGGISGKALKDLSTQRIRTAYEHLQGRLPIIGVGGIFSGEDALEKILAGASLVQIYTGYIYKGPFLPFQILEYLDKFLQKNKVDKIERLVGMEKNFMRN
ncbi:MAG: quinone-dependent dihydroorotate dehydrogenase [Leptospiraceae bacterium]|nr:quinone-dependent dihydroorotate dehydrogenase [Leptospiraceae bacterium]